MAKWRDWERMRSGPDTCSSVATREGEEEGKREEEELFAKHGNETKAVGGGGPPLFDHFRALSANQKLMRKIGIPYFFLDPRRSRVSTSSDRSHR